VALRRSRSPQPEALLGFGKGPFEDGLEVFGADAAGFEEEAGSNPVVLVGPGVAEAALYFALQALVGHPGEPCAFHFSAADCWAVH
jgi:hypothetical protein